MEMFTAVQYPVPCITHVPLAPIVFLSSRCATTHPQRGPAPVWTVHPGPCRTLVPPCPHAFLGPSTGAESFRPRKTVSESPSPSTKANGTVLADRSHPSPRLP